MFFDFDRMPVFVLTYSDKINPNESDANETRQFRFSIGLSEMVSSKLNPPDLKTRNILCRALYNFFKKMKQNFQLHYFYAENVNATLTQVCCTLIAKLLLNSYNIDYRRDLP